jgi:formate C-acetyltransferase
MNERIKRLRQQSLNGKNRISSERARLITQFYQSSKAQEVSLSAAVQRAMAFKYLLENKKIYINADELIVGERGPAPKAAPTYPEICIHSLKDLDIINSREKVSFSVDDKTRKLYHEEIIPFWKGRSIRDRIFNEMSENWKAAYESGIFTEFLEQRAPGHTVLGDKIYKKGFLDLKKEINTSIESLDY